MISIDVQLRFRFNTSIAHHQLSPLPPPPQPPLPPSPQPPPLFLPAFPAITFSPGRFPSLFPHVSLLSLPLSCARHRSFPLRLRVSSLTCYSGGGGGGGGSPCSLCSLFLAASLLLLFWFPVSLFTFSSRVLLLHFLFASLLSLSVLFHVYAYQSFFHSASLAPTMPACPLPFSRVCSPSPFSPLQPRRPLAPQAKITN